MLASCFLFRYYTLPDQIVVASSSDEPLPDETRPAPAASVPPVVQP